MNVRKHLIEKRTFQATDNYTCTIWLIFGRWQRFGAQWTFSG